jgi:mono/diheme cytochrome c family protein
MPMKFKLICLVFTSFILFGFFFWDSARSDTVKPVKKKSGFYFKMGLVKEGRRLVKKLGCNDCHTAGYLKLKGNVPEKKWLTGDTIGWRGPLGTSYGSNLRLLINDFKEDEWIKMAKTLNSPAPMPHAILNAMSDEELRSVYWFIRYLGPSGEPAPAFKPLPE